MSIETLLIQDRAERMSLEQLQEEAAICKRRVQGATRCSRGLYSATNATAKRRFETRLAVILAEIQKRESATATSARRAA